MELQYYKVQHFDRDMKPCQYNEGCRCNDYQKLNCHRCGWNPKVAQRRAEKLLEKGCK